MIALISNIVSEQNRTRQLEYSADQQKTCQDCGENLDAEETILITSPQNPGYKRVVCSLCWTEQRPALLAVIKEWPDKGELCVDSLEGTERISLETGESTT